MRLLKFWSIIFLGIVSMSAHAQEKFVVFNEEVGYCSHSYHIIQDDFGFLWSATLTGLVKTDGYEYKKFTSDRTDSTSIASNFSGFLFEDRYSNIWVNSHQYGLSIYDRSEDQFIRIKAGGKEGLKSDIITDIISIQDSVIYICGNKGLEKTILSNDSYKKMTFELYTFDTSKKVQSQWNSHIWDAELLDGNRLFLSSIMGFAMFDAEEDRFIYADEDPLIPSGVGFASCYDKSRNALWIARASLPLLKIDLETGNRQEIPDVVIKGGEQYMHIDRQDRLWIKENGFGIIVVDLDSEIIRSYDASTDSEINHKDRWSKRWLETLDGSIFLASNSDSRFQHIPSIQRKIESKVLLNSTNNSTSSIYEDDNFLLVSFYNNGLFYRNKSTHEEGHLTTQNSEIQDDLILSIKRLRDGVFLILGKPHAYLFDARSKSLSVISTSFFYRNGVELSNGDIWVFSEAYAVDRLRKNSAGKYEKVAFDSELNKYINYREAIENKDGTIWIITAANGLILTNVDGDILKEYSVDHSRSESIISKTSECLFKDSKGRIWVGSLEGLSVLDPETEGFLNFTVQDGLDDTSISDVIEDNSGQIWVSSFDGLYTYDEKEKSLNRVPQSHLLNSNFGQRGFFKYENVIYAAGTKGIDIIQTIEKTDNDIPPIIQITNLYKNDERYGSRKNLELESDIVFGPEDRDVSIEFAALHYGTPFSKKYEYREVNSNSEWIDFTSSRRISMSRFSYGTHTLEVRASNADGVWSDAKQYSFTLDAPWYNTYWFYTLLCLGLGGIIHSAYRWKIDQLENIKQKQIEIDKQIAEIEMKALKAQMNPHFIFNSLNSVKALILEHKTDEAIIYLTSFSKLIRKILNNSNDKFVRLQDELETVKLYLELEALRFDDAFVYQINIHENVSADFIEVPALLLQPYIENAIWHGLLHKSIGSKLLTIDIKRKTEEIVIEVVDNGIGREAAQKIKTRSKSKDQSYGMAINSQRIELLKELYGNNAGIEIVDLIDENQEAIGTKVIIKFIAQD